MTVELSYDPTAETLETLINRTRRQFVAGGRQLGFGAVGVESVEVADD